LGTSNQTRTQIAETVPNINVALNTESEPRGFRSDRRPRALRCQRDQANSVRRGIISVMMSGIGTQRQVAALCSLPGSSGRADADRRG
jgi:hypothetical protein